MISRLVVLSALVPLLALGATGCSGTWTWTPGGSTPPSTAQPAPSAASTSPREPSSSATNPTPDDPGTPAADQPDKSVSWEELEGDMRTARRAVNSFWSLHWSEYFTGEYLPPDVEGLYDSSSKDELPTCGDEPVPADNAVYCGEDDFVAWDKVLMRRGQELGDAWVYLIIAHEWGHAVQARLNKSYVSEASELQADCLAAAELYGASEDGNFTFEDGDLDEVVDALQDVADDTEWTEVGDHGDATERIAAFQDGKRDGVEGCFARS